MVAPCLASANPDDQLACGLIQPLTAKKDLDVKHILSKSSATNPTVTGSAHAVEGADQSSCELLGFDHTPTAAQRSVISNPKQPTPVGFGLLKIATFVRDATPNGNGAAWDPTLTFLHQEALLRSMQRAHGGADFTSPTLGSVLHKTAWIGGKDHASGIYALGESSDGSVVTASVDVPKEKDGQS